LGKELPRIAVEDLEEEYTGNLCIGLLNVDYFVKGHQKKWQREKLQRQGERSRLD